MLAAFEDNRSADPSISVVSGNPGLRFSNVDIQMYPNFPESPNLSDYFLKEVPPLIDSSCPPSSGIIFIGSYTPTENTLFSSLYEEPIDPLPFNNENFPISPVIRSNQSPARDLIPIDQIASLNLGENTSQASNLPLLGGRETVQDEQGPIIDSDSDREAGLQITTLPLDAACGPWSSGEISSECSEQLGKKRRRMCEEIDSEKRPTSLTRKGSAYRVVQGSSPNSEHYPTKRRRASRNKCHPEDKDEEDTEEEEDYDHEGEERQESGDEDDDGLYDDGQPLSKKFGKYCCPAGCGMTFTRRNDVRRHMATASIHKTADEKQDTECPFCHRQLSRPDARRRHIARRACGKRIPAGERLRPAQKLKATRKRRAGS